MKSAAIARSVLAAALAFGLAESWPAAAAPPAWQEDFPLGQCRWLTTGRNPYAVLEPGYRLVLEGGGRKLEITVLGETRVVAGVTTRIVEEREWEKNALREVARNYVAICETTGDLFYFGEDVDMYRNGKIASHDGSWLAGANGNRAGLLMPGTPTVGMRYYQEIAPGIAMDRAEIVSIDETCRTPAGAFKKCLKVRESSALDPKMLEDKYFAPGIGLVRDDELRLTRHGFVGRR